MDYQNDFQDMIARYNRELLRTYQKHRPEAPEPPPKPEPPTLPPPKPPVPPREPEDTRPHYPLFEPQPMPPYPGEPRMVVWGPAASEPLAEAAAEPLATPEETETTAESATEPTPPQPMPEPTPTPEPMPAPAPPAQELPMEVGYLQVWVSTARDALPIEGAHVTVSSTENGERIVRFIGLTDQSGRTTVFPLPAVSRQLSLVPGNNPTPYTPYNIEVAADGYFKVENLGLPMYAGVRAIQPVQLVPLPEFGTENDTTVFTQNGPAGLSGEEAGQA